MSSRSNGKKGKKKTRFNPVRLAVTVIMVFMLAGLFVSAKNIVSLHIEKRELESRQEQLEAEKSSKKNELKSVNDLDYIEEQARRQLKMIKPGEVLYILDDEETKQPDSQKPEEESEN